MYAVIETGGKQYRVELGTELQVELLGVEPGNTVTLDRVLLVADGDEAAIGRPIVAGAAVSAEVLRQDRGEKLISFKYRPKARSRVKKGHRQELTVLRVNDIVYGGQSAAEAAARAEQDAKSERQRLEEAGAAQAAKDAELAARLAAKEPSAATTRRKAGAATPSEAPIPSADVADAAEAADDASETADTAGAVSKAPPPAERKPSRARKVAPTAPTASTAPPEPAVSPDEFTPEPVAEPTPIEKDE
ncbi:MAG: 50S ribosomal protein L21 [Candidatus Limnocylindrales bacterium]